MKQRIVIGHEQRYFANLLINLGIGAGIFTLIYLLISLLAGYGIFS